MSDSEKFEGQPGKAWEARILILSFLAIGASGFIGYGRAFPHEHPLSRLFYSLQMFVLEAPDLPEGVEPLILLSARLLAAALSSWIALRFVLALLKQDWRQVSLLWFRGHIVLCGLGELGLPLALEARRRGKKLVAIERDPEAPGVAEARKAGVLVLFGDAAGLETLRRARAHRAKEILALCSDAINVGIADRVASRKPAPEGLGDKVRCRIAVSHSALRESLRNLPNPYRDAARVETQELNISEMRARQAFNEFPLDFRPLPEPAPGEKGKAATLVLVGFGEMGQALAIQAARIGIFASGEKLRVAVVEKEPESCLATFHGLVPRFQELCEVRSLGGSLDEPGLLEGMRRLVEEAKDRDEPVTVAVCGDRDDAGNLSRALKVSQALGEALCLRILVHFATESGFSHFLPSAGSLHPFGMREQVWNHDTLLEESLDAAAKHLHESYRLNERKRREKLPAGSPEATACKPADRPWEDLPERFRISNRSSADHIPIKARALGFRIASLGAGSGTPGERITDFRDKVEMLARLEHARWYANHRLDGWNYHPVRDDNLRRHNMLKPWDELKAEDRHIDVHMVASASDALEKAGLGIYR